MTNQKLLEKREKLNTYLGQLIDLQKGFLKELVITEKDTASLLREIIAIAIANIDLELKKDN